MSHPIAVVRYETPSEAETRMQAMHQAGFDMQNVSVVGKDSHPEVSDYWDRLGVSWGWLWGQLFGACFLDVPALGTLVIAGPLAYAINSKLERAGTASGVTAFAAALADLGLSREEIVRHETALRLGQFLVVVRGSPAEIDLAKDVLEEPLTACVPWA